MLFDKALAGLPEASNFTVLRKVNNGVFQKTEVKRIGLKQGNQAVELTVESIGNSDEDQAVIYSVSYKNAASALSQPFTVNKRNTIVKGSLLYLRYTDPTPIGIYNMTIYLDGVSGTEEHYTNKTVLGGSFTFDNVSPGNYKINVYLGLTRYSTNEFIVEAGQPITLPDLIIKEDTPVPDVVQNIYADLGYMNGSFLNLNEPFSVKVELEDGTILHTPGKFNMFFSVNLLENNPNLVLSGGDILYVTLYADSGWKSKRFEVNVVERPKTKSPTVTSVVYDDTRYLKGTVEDWSNEIDVTKADGTLIGRSHNHLGTILDVYLFENAQLRVGEQILVYAQAEGKRKSDPTSVTVVSPTVVTPSPTVTGVVYEGVLSISGKAEEGAIIIVKRADGSIIGEGKAGYQYLDVNFNVSLLSPTIAGEILHVSAKGYEKVVSGPVQVAVQTRPVTATPAITGEVYSDYDTIQATVFPYLNVSVDLYIKDMSGKILASGYSFNGSGTLYNLHLLPNMQYQLTAKATGMKESLPFLFTTIAPTVKTAVPIITAPVYADANYKLPGLTEPFATLYYYYEDGTLIYSYPANERGEFTFSLPSFPPMQPGQKLKIQAYARGKLISDELVLTAIAPVVKSSMPTVTGQVYGYTNALKGVAAPSSIIYAYHEDGSVIYTGVYSDMNTGQWSILLAFSVLRGGEKIYLTAHEAGKLTSDRQYITIQSAPTKSVAPIVTSTLNAQSKYLRGTYSGPDIVNHMSSIILLVNNMNQEVGVSYVASDGSFSIDLSTMKLVNGQTFQVIAKENLKEASDPVVITVN
ncbi:Ig-like domain-containing protein [Paenibacillus sp. N3.4]|uniref:Ig-like domain-containing protein n=1 Tax=Paenibacillus sp. N3.4 TaxID=2603222 RepID=UPI0011CAC787|nr:Ig-like domain-containing protein [Paenibacillus sp. N3.4]TXK83601.1 carboxypeptidase regulatory-like domain-containing protein [Paenibacillus sp. N3.4]